MEPYQLSIEEIVKKYHTDPHRGLTSQDAHARLQEYGPNLIPEKPLEPWLSIFIKQFKSPLIYILLIAATIIFFIGTEKFDAFIISGILIFNALIGTLQERRTRIVLHSLKQFFKTTSIVLRDGKTWIVNDKDLVVGDIIILQEGVRVPADARVIESNNMHVDQAVLTGESDRVPKITAPITHTCTVIDQTNMIFRQTYVLMGSGKAVITATGTATQIGHISQLIKETVVIAPLQKELENLSRWILVSIFIFCILLLCIGLMTGKPLKELLVILTALFICVIPEGLPIVLSLILVTGTWRMAKKNVLIKNMQAIDALGRATIIVLDKTGTLTHNELMVSHVCVDNTIWDVSGTGYQQTGTISCHGVPWTRSADEMDPVCHLGIASCLLNSTEIKAHAHGFDVKGDPTEAAMNIFSKKVGLSRTQLENSYKKIYEIPFSSQYSYHAVFYQKDDQCHAYIAGPPEIIFSRCTSLSAGSTQECLKQFLAHGLRTIAVATKQLPLNEIKQGPQNQNAPYYHTLITRDMILIGLCGLQDALRADVAQNIEHTRNAGLSIIMATGDHKQTALFIAKKAGIFQPGDTIIDGEHFEDYSDKDLLEILDHLSVFARVSPQHKLRLINLLHQKHHIVVMTGDGVNDTPSLAAADVGIAMGRIGTEVAKEAADVVLLDDSFTSIINAIEEGRHLFYTLKRIVLYFFSTNMAEIFIVLCALIAQLPLPINAAQILWLNLITDGFLDSALSVEPLERNLLKKKFIEQQLTIVDWTLAAKTMFVAVPMALGSLWIFYQYYQHDLVLARTLTLITMALFQWFNAWNCRSIQQSLLQIGFLSNKWLIAATTLVLGLQILLVYNPMLQALFKTVPLTGSQWFLAITVSSSIIWIEEIRKFFARRLYPE